MTRFWHARDSRRTIALLLIALTAAAVVASVHLAIAFSPFLLLVALLCFDRRVEAAIVEIVQRLGRTRPRGARHIGARPSGRPAQLISQLGFLTLGSRAPPLCLS